MEWKYLPKKKLRQIQKTKNKFRWQKRFPLLPFLGGRLFLYIQNLHTHTAYCDGTDRPEELVIAAVEKDFDSIVFSGHSYMTYSPVFVRQGDKT